MTLRGAEFIFINPFHLISVWPALLASVILSYLKEKKKKKSYKRGYECENVDLPKKGLKELHGSQEMLNAFSFCCVEPRSKKTDFFELCSAARISNLQHGCWQRKSRARIAVSWDVHPKQHCFVAPSIHLLQMEKGRGVVSHRES